MSYTPDFSGVWAKIDRAREHAETLNRETGWHFDPAGNPVRVQVHRIPVRLEYEPETGYHVFRATRAVPEDVVRRWGVITGDAIHNLRSALEHLVWQLSLAGTGGVTPGNPPIIKFPVQDTPPADRRPENFQRTAALYKVEPKYRAIIYEHQPHGSRFNFGHGPVHPFSRLRDLSNLDKHQLVIRPDVAANHFAMNPSAIFAKAGGEVIEWHAGGGMGKPPVRDAELMRVEARPASLQLNMDVAGYVFPEPAFVDVVLGNPLRYTRSVHIELTNSPYALT